MGIHTSLISLPDPALKNIFSFVGNKAIVCKKIKEFQERRAKDLGAFIFKSHAQDDFFTKIHGKSCYRLDFSIDNISSLPSEDTWDKLKREFVDLRELRIHGSNVSLIQQIIRVFREISHLSITIKPASDQDTRSSRSVEARSRLSLQLVTQGLEDLRNLKAIQLIGVEAFFEPVSQVFEHVERVDFTDSYVRLIDWNDPQGPSVVGLSPDIKYVRMTRSLYSSNEIKIFRQFAPNCVVEYKDSTSKWLRVIVKTIETAERCSHSTFPLMAKVMIVVTPIVTILFSGALLGAIGFTAMVSVPVFTPFLLAPTYSRVIESALEMTGQDAVPLEYTKTAGQLVAIPVTYALTYTAYKIAKSVLGVSRRVWSSVRSIFRCGRREQNPVPLS
jgi:hypothetical protein